jgi:hypothetical protein
VVETWFLKDIATFRIVQPPEAHETFVTLTKVSCMTSSSGEAGEAEPASACLSVFGIPQTGQVQSIVKRKRHELVPRATFSGVQ